MKYRNYEKEKNINGEDVDACFSEVIGFTPGLYFVVPWKNINKRLLNDCLDS